ncbi:MAG: lipoate--protein ligase family protein [Chloroflexota bacterium]
MLETWRVIPPEPFAGPENMAIDEALLALVGEGEAPPTLRFYEWRSPWVALGTGQAASDLDLTALAERGWALLRRASGGTAVLHRGQLGYAVILPTSHPLWEGDLPSSYQRIATPLALGLSRLGVLSEPAPPSLKATFAAGAPPVAARVCFSALGPYELLDRCGRKLTGNSQIRRRHGSLQHGTIQVSGNQAELVDVLAGLEPSEMVTLAAYLQTRVGSLEASAGREISGADLADALGWAFEETLGICLSAGDLSGRERCAAAELVTTKYRDPGWTNRR